MRALLAVALVLAVLADPSLAFFQYTVCYKNIVVPAYELGGSGNHLVMARVCAGPYQDPEGMGGTCPNQGVIFDFEYDAKKWMKANCN